MALLDFLIYRSYHQWSRCCVNVAEYRPGSQPISSEKVPVCTDHLSCHQPSGTDSCLTDHQLIEQVHNLSRPSQTLPSATKDFPSEEDPFLQQYGIILSIDATRLAYIRLIGCSWTHIWDYPWHSVGVSLPSLRSLDVLCEAIHPDIVPFAELRERLAGSSADTVSLSVRQVGAYRNAAATVANVKYVERTDAALLAENPDMYALIILLSVLQY